MALIMFMSVTLLSKSNASDHIFGYNIYLLLEENVTSPLCHLPQCDLVKTEFLFI